MRLADIDIVQTAIREAGQHVVGRFTQAAGWWKSHARGLLRAEQIGADRPLESPAEAVFQLWFDALDYESEAQRRFPLLRQVEVVAALRLYRLDFRALWVNQEGRIAHTPIVIEIDGHAFHERTKEQVTDGHRRDRALAAAGFIVLHYNFDELLYDPCAAAQDARQAIIAWTGRQVGDAAQRCA